MQKYGFLSNVTKYGSDFVSKSPEFTQKPAQVLLNHQA